MVGVQLLPQYGRRCAQLVPADSVTLSGTRRAVVASPAQRRSRDSIILLTNSAPLTYDTIRYDTRCYFNVRSKADISQLNLPHGTDQYHAAARYSNYV